MIKHYCDITKKMLTEEEIGNTKEPQTYTMEVNGHEIVLRAYFSVNNESCGELSNEGIKQFFRYLADH